MKQPTLTIVIGMHRSGTSLISRSLQVFGISHGSNMLFGSDNAKGHWEEQEFIDLNDKILNLLDRKWSSISPIKSTEWSKIEMESLTNEARDLMLNRLNLYANYGFKDPRTTLLLPFWHNICQLLGVTPKFIFSIRSPFDVAASLKDRNEFPTSRSLYIWLNYNLSALKFLSTPDRSYVVVDYKAMIENPGAELERVSRMINIPPRAQELDAYIRNFVDPKLNHHSKHIHRSACNDALLNCVLDVHEFLLSATHKPEILKTPDGLAKIQQWSDEMIRHQQLLELCDRAFDEAQRSQESAAHATAARSHAEAELNAVLMTQSWKLTQPLRAIKQLIRPLISIANNS